MLRSRWFVATFSVVVFTILFISFQNFTPVNCNLTDLAANPTTGSRIKYAHCLLGTNLQTDLSLDNEITRQVTSTMISRKGILTKIFDRKFDAKNMLPEQMFALFSNLLQRDLTAEEQLFWMPYITSFGNRTAFITFISSETFLSVHPIFRNPPNAILAGHELVILDPGVLESTQYSVRCRYWTFCNAIDSIRGKNKSETIMSEWLKEWERVTSINGFPVGTRSPNPFRNAFKVRSNGKLDLENAPVRLLAIVFRPDLRKEGQGGEGRLVFEVLNSVGQSERMTIIFEYGLPLVGRFKTALAWAEAFHELSNYEPGSYDFNRRLATITKYFVAKPNAKRRENNKSNINQVRTNEILFAPQWQLREFRIDPSSGLLKQVTVKQTPDQSFNNSFELAQMIDSNTDAILNNTFEVPSKMLGGKADVGISGPAWNASVSNPLALRKFAVNTCNGCHGSETATGFLHISNRLPGRPATLSPFFTGVTVNGQTFNELEFRRADLRGFLGLLPEDGSRSPAPQVPLRKNRIH